MAHHVSIHTGHSFWWHVSHHTGIHTFHALRRHMTHHVSIHASHTRQQPIGGSSVAPYVAARTPDDLWLAGREEPRASHGSLPRVPLRLAGCNATSSACVVHDTSCLCSTETVVDAGFTEEHCAGCRLRDRCAGDECLFEAHLTGGTWRSLPAGGWCDGPARCRCATASA